MNAYRTVIVRGAAALAVTASLLTVTPIWSQTDTGNTPASQDAASRQARIHERVQARLDELAKRLEITPEQQPAWDSYAKTVQGLIPANPQKPPSDADAATLMRFRAQRASEFAQKLTQLADATSALEQTLTPEQRKVLDDTVRHIGFMGDREGMRGPHHGPMPNRGGQ